MPKSPIAVVFSHYGSRCHTQKQQSTRRSLLMVLSTEKTAYISFVVRMLFLLKISHVRTYLHMRYCFLCWSSSSSTKKNFYCYFPRVFTHKNYHKPLITDKTREWKTTETKPITALMVMGVSRRMICDDNEHIDSHRREKRKNNNDVVLYVGAGVCVCVCVCVKLASNRRQKWWVKNLYPTIMSCCVRVVVARCGFCSVCV